MRAHKLNASSFCPATQSARLYFLHQLFMECCAAHLFLTTNTGVQSVVVCSCNWLLERLREEERLSLEGNQGNRAIPWSGNTNSPGVYK